MRLGACMICFLILLTVGTVDAQNMLEEAYEQLQQGTELPEDLRSTRSIVLVRSQLSTPLSSGEGMEMLSKQFHQRLVEMNIDAVAYFRWQDLVAGFDATNSYIKAIKDREVGQIIILQAKPNSFEAYITHTSEDNVLFDLERPNWYSNSNTLEGLMENLATAVRMNDLEIANFLIAETPEFFIDTKIFTKNRFDSFQPDLKLDKLAVPLFHGKDLENLENSEDQELKTIMETHYPFSYELVSSEMTEDLMKKAGFHYVLRFLHGEESTLLTLLDYEDDANEPTKIGYKFYAKHLISGDIYLGNIWDNRSSWQSALNTHLRNLKKNLKVE